MTKPNLESELPSKKKKKQSLLGKLKDFVYPTGLRNDKPMTFNMVLAYILFVVFFIMMLVSFVIQPALLLLCLPTIYLIARNIRFEREKRSEYKILNDLKKADKK